MIHIECLFLLALLIFDIAILPEVEEGILSFICHIDNLQLLPVFSVDLEAFVNHVKFFLSVKQLVEAKGRNKRTVDQHVDSESEFHDCGHGWEGCEFLQPFVGVLEVFIANRV